MIEQAIEAFVQEASEILVTLEDGILALEENASPEKVGEIFRALHTVKGSGAMFGYTCLSRFTHHFENAFELVRAEKLKVDSTLVDLCLKARDVMTDFLAMNGDNAQSEALLASDRVTSLIAELTALTGDEGVSSGKHETETSQSSRSESQRIRRYRIAFTPEHSALRNGMRPDLLLAELADLGACEVEYDLTSLPKLSELDPTEAYMGYSITLDTGASRTAIDDVFIFADDAALAIEEISKPASETAEPLDVNGSNRSSGQSAEIDQKGTAPPTAARREVKSESIRVTSSRLDDMMDSLGELVIAQARLDAVVQDFDDPTLESVVEEVARLVVGLRDATLSIRMLPIESVFGKFKRVVRDLAGQLDKEVQLITQGGQTEVDKNVIDRIGEPIVHMIRNSIDHGIEAGDIRAAAGKERIGTIKLSARQEGGEILITIEDNGKGLDPAAIRSRAVERGLISNDEQLSDTQIFQLIFVPGFSLAKSISDVSGRGVGMDAVKSTIDALGGSVDLAARVGHGTRITLRLPVTMAIIDGLRIKLGNSVYVIPLSSVEECVELSDFDSHRRSGRYVLEIRDEMVPFLELDKLFSQERCQTARRRVVIVGVDGARVGLVVDDILGQGQTVTKSLSAYHSSIPGLGGATILGDGQVALIIDVATLIRSSQVPRIVPERNVA
jgi:two-component system chemotaxis sensor kinase CheA